MPRPNLSPPSTNDAIHNATLGNDTTTSRRKPKRNKRGQYDFSRDEHRALAGGALTPDWNNALTTLGRETAHLTGSDPDHVVATLTDAIPHGLPAVIQAARDTRTTRNRRVAHYLRLAARRHAAIAAAAAVATRAAATPATVVNTPVPSPRANTVNSPDLSQATSGVALELRQFLQQLTPSS